MRIELEDIGKRFKGEWIFKNVSFKFEEGIYGVTGPNGSGKSTLLKIISQAELATEGKIQFFSNNNLVEAERAHSTLSMAAPYITLPEQLKLDELMKFHLQFKSFLTEVDLLKFYQLIYLEEAKEKRIGQFSSGMKQRLKLGLALLFKSELIILDEPCSNLDAEGIQLYKRLIKSYQRNRIIIIGSNEREKELEGMQQEISLLKYKI